MSNTIASFNASDFWKNGFSIVRNVFNAEEIHSLRKRAYESKTHKGDLLSNPQLRDLIVDERVLTLARSILESQPVYFGDSTSLLGGDSRGYHKDNADRFDGNAPDWKGKYTIIRFGLYLQDHYSHSGGLNVRIGSHNIPDEKKGRNVYLRTKVGDLAVWNLRTSHSGTGRLLRGFRNIHLPPNLAYRLPSFLFSPMEQERAALFMSFGLDDTHLKRFIDFLKTRTYMTEIWKNSNYDDGVWASTRGRDLLVKDVWKQIGAEPGLGRNELYQPIPY